MFFRHSIEEIYSAKYLSLDMKLPDITRLVGSKNFVIDAGIILLGFVIIGAASTLGTIGAKWVYNSYIERYVPNGEKVPY